MGRQRRAPVSPPYAAYAACPPPTHTKQTEDKTKVAQYTHAIARTGKDMEIGVDTGKRTYHAYFVVKSTRGERPSMRNRCNVNMHT